MKAKWLVVIAAFGVVSVASAFLLSREGRDAPERASSQRDAELPVPPVPGSLDSDAAPPGFVASSSYRDAPPVATPTPEEIAEAETPVPVGLRRVEVRITYDDGTPFAGMTAEAVPSEAGSATTDEWETAGVRTEVVLNVEGRGAFRVPKDSAFILQGDGGESSPPFKTSTVPADATVAELVVKAARSEISVTFENGAPAAGVMIGCRGPDGYAVRRLDAEGRAAFYGFGDCESTLGLFAYDESVGTERHYVFVSASGVEPNGIQALHAKPPFRIGAVVRPLPLVTGRIVDERGAVAPRAWIAPTVELKAGDFGFALDEVRSGDDGRFSFDVPRNDVQLAADAEIAAISVVVRAPHDRDKAAAARCEAGDGDFDLGDIVVAGPRWLKFRVIDPAGAPAAWAVAAFLNEQGRPDPDREPTTADDSGVLTMPARPDDARIVVGYPGCLEEFADCVGVEAAHGTDGAGSMKLLQLRSGAAVKVPPRRVEPSDDQDLYVWLLSEIPLFPWTRTGGADGRFWSGVQFRRSAGCELTGVVPGVPFRVMAATVRNGVYDTYVELDAGPLSAGETREIPLPDPPRGRNVRGRVLGVDGEPVAAHVKCLRADQGLPLDAWPSFAEAKSEAASGFRFEGLPRGTYRLVYWTDLPDAWHAHPDVVVADDDVEIVLRVLRRSSTTLVVSGLSREAWSAAGISAWESGNDAVRPLGEREFVDEPGSPPFGRIVAYGQPDKGARFCVALSGATRYSQRADAGGTVRMSFDDYGALRVVLPAANASSLRYQLWARELDKGEDGGLLIDAYREIGPSRTALELGVLHLSAGRYLIEAVSVDYRTYASCTADVVAGRTGVATVKPTCSGDR